MNLNRKRVLAGAAATAVMAGALAGGGVALASTGSAPTPPAATATEQDSGWCNGDMGGMWSGRQPVMQAIANYLGLSQAQLRGELQSGKSLGDVATAQGKTVAGLKDAILAAMTSRINASTRLSADQKAAMISQVKSHLDAMVTMTHPSGAGMHWMDSPMGHEGSPMGGMYGM
jgi:hypothetical protein